ncbi:MAG TPA: pilus assembly protein TadG-related protein [Candidatus Limnocylindrales bacterium]|nr:pilus assembly protein TadG-related protein [Candidatus Limnocylindrales bacterium]
MDHRTPEGRQRGQVMVLFLLGLVAIIGMVGLVLDGGSVFAQRRDQQTAADLAAMAGAAAYLNSYGTEAERVAYAEGVATSVANANGYVEGTNGVDIAFAMHTGAFFSDAVVNLGKPHANNFAAILGMPTWDVGVTATARASWQANGARGPMPLMFNAEAFPGALCNDAVETCTPTVFQMPPPGSEDVPQDGTSFNWTVFCTAGGSECNIDSDTSSDLINGSGANTVVYLDDTIAPLNAGTHTTLFGPSDLEQKVGLMFPVPIVTDDGDAVGWGYFKLISVEGAPEKVITGYFVSPVNGEELVVNGGHKAATLFTGGYSVRLAN